MRVRLIKNHKEGKRGEIVEVSPNVGFGLIDSGYGIISKEITPDEELSKQETKHGNPTIVRAHKRR